MTLTRCSVSLAVLSMSLAACSDASGPGETIDALPRQLSAAEQKLIASSNSFAFDLFREVNSTSAGKNVFMSPLSASMALGMAANGAAGTTWEAMRTGLRLPGTSHEEIGAGYKSLIALLRGLDKSTEFQIANSIWYRNTFPFHQTFLEESRNYFDARVEGMDFTNPATVQTINAWVKEATGEKIPTILDAISRDNVMFLINAIYFKGTWQYQFDKSRTTDAPFRALDGTTATVPLMYQKSRVKVSHGADYVAVDLPYGNSAFTMSVILPAQSVGINDFVASLTESKWKSIDAAFHETETTVHLPRFKLTWEKTLKDDLASMGMGIAFVPDGADFTRMSPLGKNLFISQVLQKTYVDVNEEGTEAAAVTKVTVGVTSAPPTIRVDRPFVFAIRERLSGTILFIGKIVKLPA